MKLASKFLLILSVSVSIAVALLLCGIYIVLINTINEREDSMLKIEAREIAHHIKEEANKISNLSLILSTNQNIQSEKNIKRFITEHDFDIAFLIPKGKKEIQIFLSQKPNGIKTLPYTLSSSSPFESEGLFNADAENFIVGSQTLNDQTIYLGHNLKRHAHILTNIKDISVQGISLKENIPFEELTILGRNKRSTYASFRLPTIAKEQILTLNLDLKREVLSKLKSLYTSIVLGALALTFILIFSLYWFFNKYFLQKIHSLLQQLRTIQTTQNFQGELLLDSNDELGALANFTNKTFERIRQNYDFSERLMRLSPTAIFTIDANKTITSWNNKATELTGFTAEEVVGKSCKTFSLLPCRDFCGLFESDTPKPVFNRECVIVTKDGRKIQIQKNADLIRDRQGNIVGGIEEFEDITQKIKEKKEKEILQQQVYQTSKLASLGTLGAGIAHELNNPLSIVIGYSDLLVGKLEESGQQDLVEVVNKISQNAERMKKIIMHIKDFSRDSSRDEKTPETLSDVANSILVFINKQLANRGITVDLQIALNLPKIYVNKVKMQSVFQNLLLNARDELSDLKDWPEKKITLRIYLSDDGKHQIIEVLDSGRGIHKDILDKIFEPFFTTKPTGKGTGLGLSLVYGIIGEHQGTIVASNNPVRGACFTITLPMITPEPTNQET